MTTEATGTATEKQCRKCGATLAVAALMQVGGQWYCYRPGACLERQQVAAQPATEWRVPDPQLYARIIAALDVWGGPWREQMANWEAVEIVAKRLGVDGITVTDALADFRAGRPVEALAESEEPAAAEGRCSECGGPATPDGEDHYRCETCNRGWRVLHVKGVPGEEPTAAEGEGPSPRAIAIDFDGVVHDYSAGWTGHFPEGDPLPGAREFIEELLEKGFRVFLFTCRALPEDPAWPPESERLRAIREWLTRHEFPADRMTVTGLKPHAELYIDDRAFRFRGCWGEARAALNSQPWQKAPATMGEVPGDEEEESWFRSVREDVATGVMISASVVARLLAALDSARAELEQAREERNHAKVAARREAGEELARLRADRDLLERIQTAVWSEMREGDTPEGCVLRLRADRDRLAAEVETITRERDEARAEAPLACEECGRLREERDAAYETLNSTLDEAEEAAKEPTVPAKLVERLLFYQDQEVSAADTEEIGRRERKRARKRAEKAVVKLKEALGRGGYGRGGYGPPKTGRNDRW